MVKRLFDIVLSFSALLVLLPVFVVIVVLIVLSDGLPVFYKQQRIGLNHKAFGLFKSRTMVKNADKSGKITIGKKDSRVTTIGHLLRKTKFDEFPQLLNIIKGEMSIVGPRPEVEEYVNLYKVEHQKVLSVKPGLTDYASIEYSNESELLGASVNPHETYINVVMPAKLSLNLKYIEEKGIITDLKIIFRTMAKIWT